jgi:hypothetical protein
MAFPSRFCVIHCLQQAADALVRGVRHGLDEAGNNRRPLDVIGRNIGVPSGQLVADMGTGARLVFTSPMVVRSGEQLHVRPASLIKSLAHRRSAGLARGAYAHVGSRVALGMCHY